MRMIPRVTVCLIQTIGTALHLRYGRFGWVVSSKRLNVEFNTEDPEKNDTGMRKGRVYYCIKLL